MVIFQNDPFRDLDAAFERMTSRSRSANGPAPMAMDAYRRGSDVWVHLDLPGVSLDSIDIDLERNVLTVTAQRDWAYEDDDQVYLAERRRGTFSRQVHLGDGLDAERIEATYDCGVLTLRVPVAATAQPRKIAVGSRTDAIEASGS